MSKPCSIESCEKPSRTDNWCQMHYMRWWRHGDQGPAEPTREHHGHTKAGGWRSAEYMVWSDLKRRCLNPRAANYAVYGGRGITVCDRWRDSFEAFFADMGPRPEGMTGRRATYSIDRTDDNGSYTCGKCAQCLANGWTANCRWITQEQQANNMRSNRMLTYDGQTHTLAEWSRVVGVTKKMLSYRLKAGWSVKDALTTPTKKSAV